MAAISYINFFIAVIIFLVQPENKYVKFHAVQAIAIDISFIVVWVMLVAVIFLSFFTFVLPFLLIPFLGLVCFSFRGFKIFMIYKAYKAEEFRVPVITEKILGFLGGK